MSGIGFLLTFQVSPFIGSLFSGILDNLYIFKGVTTAMPHPIPILGKENEDRE